MNLSSLMLEVWRLLMPHLNTIIKYELYIVKYILVRRVRLADLTLPGRIVRRYTGKQDIPLTAVKTTIRIAAVALILNCPLGRTQAPGQPPQFEVASIEPNKTKERITS